MSRESKMRKSRTTRLELLSCLPAASVCLPATPCAVCLPSPCLCCCFPRIGVSDPPTLSNKMDSNVRRRMSRMSRTSRTTREGAGAGKGEREPRGAGEGRGHRQEE